MLLNLHATEGVTRCRGKLPHPGRYLKVLKLNDLMNVNVKELEGEVMVVCLGLICYLSPTSKFNLTLFTQLFIDMTFDYSN